MLLYNENRKYIHINIIDFIFYTEMNLVVQVKQINKFYNIL